MKVMVTGAAGFIGFHTSKRLLDLGYEVCGLDSYNDYYDPDLKRARARELPFRVESIDLRDDHAVDYFFEKHKPDAVIHLAAYAGVRTSLEFPQLYMDNNINGTQNLINSCEKYGTDIALYASTSSVMSGQPVPFKETNPGPAKHPYAMTKIANESQFNYSKINTTIGLRFFTVYGPWGRPDMALFDFTNKIVKGEPIDIYNHGKMTRDFTYVDDIVEGIIILLSECINNTVLPQKDVYNIGYGERVKLVDFVDHIEENLGRKAIRNYTEMHPADAVDTWSDTTKLRALGYNPTTSIGDGVAEFVSWYKNYYGVN